MPITNDDWIKLIGPQLEKKMNDSEYQSIADMASSLIRRCERMNVYEMDGEWLVFEFESIIMELHEIYATAKRGITNDKQGKN